MSDKLVKREIFLFFGHTFASPRKGIWGTPTGPLGHPEVATVGLDDLQQRCKQAGLLQVTEMVNDGRA